MTFSFNPKEGLILITVCFYGPNGNLSTNLALDTGAVQTMMSWELLVLLGYDPAGISERIQLTTASGIEFVPQMTLSRIEALGIARENFSLLCHSLPESASVDGVLGLDFFRDHKLQIDFREGKLLVN